MQDLTAGSLTTAFKCATGGMEHSAVLFSIQTIPVVFRWIQNGNRNNTVNVRKTTEKVVMLGDCVSLRLSILQLYSNLYRVQKRVRLFCTVLLSRDNNELSIDYRTGVSTKSRTRNYFHVLRVSIIKTLRPTVPLFKPIIHQLNNQPT